jgi:hypothetical protein
MERAVSSGEVPLLPQKITRVRLNLISNSFYATTQRRTLCRLTQRRHSLVMFCRLPPRRSPNPRDLR